MRLQEVIDKVKWIEDLGSDFEAAHSAEDKLWAEVLTAISTGQCQDAPPEDFALEALKTAEIQFSRYCA